MDLWDMSAAGSIVIGVIIMIRSLFRDKLPGKVFQILWLVALLRLLVPYSIPFAGSIYSLAGNCHLVLDIFTGDGAGNGNLASDLIGSQIENGNSASDLTRSQMENGNSASNLIGSQMENGNSAFDIHSGKRGEDALSFFRQGQESIAELVRDRNTEKVGAKSEQKESGKAEESEVLEQPEPAGIYSKDSVPVWRYLYFTGAFVCALYYLITYVRCYREFQTSLPVEESLVTEWRGFFPIRRRVCVRQWDRTISPLTYGVFHPVILLPKELAQENSEQLKFILAHEFMHIRHLDAVKKILLVLVCCVHWFNPLVWAMCVLANRDLELSCDENVVKYFGLQARSAYAHTLIRMEEQKNIRMNWGNCFSRNAMEERIVAIMKMKKDSIKACVLSAVLTAVVIVMFATSAKGEVQADECVTVSETNEQGEMPGNTWETTENVSANVEQYHEYRQYQGENTCESIEVVSANVEQYQGDNTEQVTENINVNIEQNKGDSAGQVTTYLEDDMIVSSSVSEGDKAPEIPAGYAAAGITANSKTGDWEYEGKPIAVLYDKGNPRSLDNVSCFFTSDVSGKEAAYIQVWWDAEGIQHVVNLTEKQMKELLKNQGITY